MPAEDSAAPSKGDGAGFEDADRFVFGADPMRERWMGRPLAETRWWFELARLLTDPVLYGVDVPRGDGRPVVLMPGFLAGDQTLAVIAAWLRRVGYRPQLCGFVANAGCSDHTLVRLERRVEGLWRRYGRRVALIGHSRGGHYARALAARRPDRVSHAISMGADLQGTVRSQRAHAVRGRRRAARRARHRTSAQRSMPHRPLRLLVQPRLRAAVPVRPGPAHEHLFKGRRRRPLAMSGDPAMPTAWR